MKRHAYRKNGDAICSCGQGRAEDVHNTMVWNKSSGIGFWYSGPVNGVAYRVRCRKTNAVWWPEFSLLAEENWTRIGDGIGVSLAQAKLMCEEHRESREEANAR